MDNLTPDQRQMFGCGYEPPPADNLRPFVGIPRPEGYSDDEPTVCPGYSTSLPETIEIARGWLHWTKGALREYTGGQPTVAMVAGIEVLSGASSDCERYWMTPRSKGGGGEG